jgi:hypothetical protein
MLKAPRHRQPERVTLTGLGQVVLTLKTPIEMARRTW